MNINRAFLSFITLGCFSINSCLGQAEDFRLPRSIIPTNYTLQMQPILDETPGHTRFTAPGTVKIIVHCTEDTDTIKLHALDLTIVENSTRVTSLNDGQVLSISRQSTEPQHHFFVITIGGTLKAGSQYEIFIQFITPVSQTRLDGMYLDQYVDPVTNETKYVATTLFAAISARRCFPCFDEPHLKAVFSVSLARKESYHSLTNMHQVSSAPLPGMEEWHLDQFAPSLPMSTYLVAMIVSDMTFEQAVLPQLDEQGNNATIRVYAPYYLIDRGGGVYAANQTKTVLQKFDNYFDSTFMLQKLDSVSLPRFFFNAMENWALITYNDKVLLYFPGESTEQERYRITSIIAHEVVHHYFGNMVTCEWWTWIWLNEGSATYFSHLGVEMTYPEFNPWDRFINDVYQVAMEFDSSPQTHPVANEPKSLADIGGVYDDIAYEKGASLIRMMQSFLSEGVVQSAIRRYLKEKQFQNARQDDLFNILQETAEQLNKTQPVSVKEIMDTWTLQSGFPLLRVSRINDSAIKLTQEKFEINGTANNIKASDDKWWIPISISVVAPTRKEYFFWMSNDQEETTFSIPEEEVFVLNPRSEGYYRTLYSSDLLERLFLSQLTVCTLPSKAKAKLLDDYVAFKKAGLSNLSNEAILNSLCLESENLLVWETLLKDYIKELLGTFESRNFTHTETVKDYMKKNLLGQINSALERIENVENNLIGETMMLRSELLFWTCLLAPEQVICGGYAEKKMQSWEVSQHASDEMKSISSPFQSDFEDTYFCVAASQSDQHWHRIYEFMNTKRKMPCTYARTISALACTKNVKLFEKVYPKLQKEFKEFAEPKGISKLRINGENSQVIRTALRILLNENVRNVSSIIHKPK